VLPIPFRCAVGILGATSGTCCSIPAKADSNVRLHCRTIVDSISKYKYQKCRDEWLLTSDLCHACWICLHQRAEPSISRVFLLIVSNFVKSLAPGLRKLWQMGGDDAGMHESNTSDRDCCIFVETPRSLGVQEDGDETANKWVHPLCELRIICKADMRSTPKRKERRNVTYHVHSAERPLQQTKPRYYTHSQTRLSAPDPTGQSARP